MDFVNSSTRMIYKLFIKNILPIANLIGVTVRMVALLGKLRTGLKIDRLLDYYVMNTRSIAT